MSNEIGKRSSPSKAATFSGRVEHQPNVSQTNGAANQASPAASWRIFASIDAEHAGFLPVYLVRRGSAHGPKFLLVWHVAEIRWVSSGALERARRNAGNEAIDWAPMRFVGIWQNMLSG